MRFAPYAIHTSSYLSNLIFVYTICCTILTLVAQASGIFGMIAVFACSDFTCTVHAFESCLMADSIGCTDIAAAAAMIDTAIQIITDTFAIGITRIALAALCITITVCMRTTNKNAANLTFIFYTSVVI